MPTIVDIATNTEKFSILIAAMKAANLVEMLSSDGPFTVFAPNDDAFIKLPPGMVQALVDNPPQLARILKHHVVPGSLRQADLVDADILRSLENSPIPVCQGVAFEVKNATVLAADIEASNGIVHVVDNVILPG